MIKFYTINKDIGDYEPVGKKGDSKLKKIKTGII